MKYLLLASVLDCTSLCYLHNCLDLFDGFWLFSSFHILILFKLDVFRSLWHCIDHGLWLGVCKRVVQRVVSVKTFPEGFSRGWVVAIQNSYIFFVKAVSISFKSFRFTSNYWENMVGHFFDFDARCKLCTKLVANFSNKLIDLCSKLLNKVKISLFKLVGNILHIIASTFFHAEDWSNTLCVGRLSDAPLGLSFRHKDQILKL